LSRLDSNHNPSDLLLPSSWDCIWQSFFKTVRKKMMIVSLKDLSKEKETNTIGLVSLILSFNKDLLNIYGVFNTKLYSQRKKKDSLFTITLYILHIIRTFCVSHMRGLRNIY
jgi:hypothetical protein